jgi:hypothetical protein
LLNKFPTPSIEDSYKLSVYSPRNNDRIATPFPFQFDARNILKQFTNFRKFLKKGQENQKDGVFDPCNQQAARRF